MSKVGGVGGGERRLKLGEPVLLEGEWMLLSGGACSEWVSNLGVAGGVGT